MTTQGAAGVYERGGRGGVIHKGRFVGYTGWAERLGVNGRNGTATTKAPDKCKTERVHKKRVDLEDKEQMETKKKERQLN